MSELAGAAGVKKYEWKDAILIAAGAFDVDEENASHQVTVVHHKFFEFEKAVANPPRIFLDMIPEDQYVALHDKVGQHFDLSYTTGGPYPAFVSATPLPVKADRAAAPGDDQ